MLGEFVQQIEDTVRSIMEEMHTSIPAKIVKFDAEKGMAEVKPYGTFVTEAGKKIDYPMITGVPVIFPQCQSKQIQLAFPIKEGEDCLVLFSETELDAWLLQGESENDMRFDLTSAIAIPGLSRTGNASLKEACSEESIILQNGNTKLKVKKTEVEIIGDLKVSGEIKAKEDVKANIKATAISLKNHTHSTTYGETSKAK